MRTGVLFMTIGGPRTIEAVPDFIRRFTGRELPQPVMNAIIERYTLIGGCSPLPRITEEQASAVNALLGNDHICRAAFRYSQPFIGECIDGLISNGADRLIFLLLSHFYTSVTTGNYMTEAREHLRSIADTRKTLAIHSWHAEPSFIKCWTDKIRTECPEANNVHFIFSAHSLPEKYLSEPYKQQIEDTVKAIAEAVPLEQYTLGWQSIPGQAREPWIGPTVETVIDGLAGSGIRTIVQVPVGFTADHIETLYDIDITHKQYAESKGFTFRRVSSLNTDPAFIRMLAGLVKHSKGEPL